MCVCWVGTDLFRTSCQRSHGVQWLISKHCELIPGCIGRAGQDRAARYQQKEQRDAGSAPSMCLSYTQALRWDSTIV